MFWGIVFVEWMKHYVLYGKLQGGGLGEWWAYKTQDSQTQFGVQSQVWSSLHKRGILKLTRLLNTLYITFFY